MEPEGTERGCSWPFVPFLLGKILGVASQITTNDNLFGHATAQQQQVARTLCPPSSTVMSISIKQCFICARSVGPFGPPKEEKGVKHMFFLLKVEKRQL